MINLYSMDKVVAIYRFVLNYELVFAFILNFPFLTNLLHYPLLLLLYKLEPNSACFKEGKRVREREREKTEDCNCKSAIATESEIVKPQTLYQPFMLYAYQ
jgi:hypothetical protein